MAAQPMYKVIFVNQGKVYEIYARNISHGSLFGFIEIEKLVFGARSSVVVDPAGRTHPHRVRRREQHVLAAAFDRAHRQGRAAGGVAK